MTQLESALLLAPSPPAEKLIALTSEGTLRRRRSMAPMLADGDMNQKEGVGVASPSLNTLETSRGYLLQGRGRDPLTVVGELGELVTKTLCQARVGEKVALQLGGLRCNPHQVPLPPLPEAYWTSDHSTRVPRRMSVELAEFIGYFMGDGSLHSKGIRLCVAQGDEDVLEHLTYLGEVLFGIKAIRSQRAGYIELAFNSVRLVLWWEACGFAKVPPVPGHRGKGYVSLIPEAVLYSDNKQMYTAFIRGLFEADGTVNNHYVSWTTTTFSFSRDIQTLLLALGFVTTRKQDLPTKSSWGTNTKYVLRLLNTSSIGRFLEEIGFISKRKSTLVPLPPHVQSARYDHIPITREEIDRLVPNNDRLRQVLLLSSARNCSMSRRTGEELLRQTGDQNVKQRLSFYYDQIVNVSRATDGTL